jgi:Smg protein
MTADERTFRIFSNEECARLEPACRGLLLSLERAGILTPGQREIAIERLLALDTEELDLEQVKWVVLMVLSSQPGQEAACARMEDLVYETPETVPH